MGLRTMAYRAGVIGADFSVERQPRQRHARDLQIARASFAPRNPCRKKLKVLLVDDHPLVREWLATLINQQSDLEVCGEADSAPKALQMMGAVNPEIAIVDISMEGGSGLELIKNIKASHPDVMVIVLSMHDEALYAERALRAGARGYIMKREATKGVLQAIRCVLAGSFT